MEVTVMPTISLRESIPSKGEGVYTDVEGRVIIPSGRAHSRHGHRDVGDGRQGSYDYQYTELPTPDFGDRLPTDEQGMDGGYRAIITVVSTIHGRDNPVVGLRLTNWDYPNHQNVIADAPESHKPMTKLYAESDLYPSKRSLVVMAMLHTLARIA